MYLGYTIRFQAVLLVMEVDAYQYSIWGNFHAPYLDRFSTPQSETCILRKPLSRAFQRDIMRPDLTAGTSAAFTSSSYPPLFAHLLDISTNTSWIGMILFALGTYI